MKNKFLFIVPLLALGVAGCASTPVQPDASKSHPANAHATEGAFLPQEPTLMSGADPMTTNPDNDPALEHQHDHGKHGMKPKTEEPK